MTGAPGSLLSQPFRLPSRVVDAQLLETGGAVFLAENGDVLFQDSSPNPTFIDATFARFQALGDNEVIVMGYDGTINLDNAPFPTQPKTRQNIGSNVIDFQAMNNNEVYVVGSDNVLAQATGPWAHVTMDQVDTDVAALQAFPSNPPRAYVLDTRGVLWGEIGPWGRGQARHQVDTNVSAFQGIGVLNDGYQVFVLDRAGDLFYEFGAWGTVKRTKVDGNVRQFQMISETELFVLGDNGNLWLEHLGPPGLTMTRVQVDGNVQTFRALDLKNVAVIGTDGKLWIEEAPWGPVPPQRFQLGRALP